MDWSHPNRRGYFDRNKAFITRSPSPLTRRAHRGSDPGDVQRQRRTDAPRWSRSLRALLDARISTPVAITEYREARDFALVDVNAAGLLEGHDAGSAWAAPAAAWTAAERRRESATTSTTSRCSNSPAPLCVMGNATEALKSRGYRPTASNDEDGLALAVRSCLQCR